MISYQVYKLIHFLGIFMLLASVGAVVAQRVLAGGAPLAWRKPPMIAHGVGLFLVLLGGFGMLARMGLVSGLPGWIHGKLAVWALLGAALFVARKWPQLAKPVWWASMVLAATAAYLALNKPF